MCNTHLPGSASIRGFLLYLAMEELLCKVSLGVSEAEKERERKAIELAS